MKRKEINPADLESIVGGVLHWKGNGTVYAEDNPDAIYHYSDYSECLAYIKKNWHGGAQTEDTLKMLEEAGLVW